MPTLYLICGFIGSGKTTYAKQLAQDESAFRFSIDEWMIPLYGEHMAREVFTARLATLQGLFKQAALQMLNLNVSVIFDFGFWTKADRDAISAWAIEQGVDCQLIYLEASYDDCCERALKRNATRHGESYAMTPEMLDMFWSWFEAPQGEPVKVIPNR